MFRTLFRFTFVFSLVLVAAIRVNVQSNMPDASTNDRGSKAKQDNFPKNIKESLAKSRIEREKKEFKKIIQRGKKRLKLIE